MKYKAIIFDMDGTIINSEHIWRKATKDLVESKTGEIASPELLEELENELKGLELKSSCKIIKDKLGLTHEVLDLAAEKKQRALDIFKEGIKFIEGFKNFHGRVLEQNLKIGIATNADDHTLEAAIVALELKTLFGDHIYNITHVNGIHKPKPDLYLHVAEKLGIAPEECIAIEDSAHGVKAAVDAGMFCIGINTAKDEKFLQESHLIINHYDDICLERLFKLKNADDKA
jgi:HAD superfamily hydrolase (TIGR01509 family)